MTFCLNSLSEEEDIDLIRDRGFLVGDGVFETLKVKEGIPLWLSDHLTRLRFHARKIGLPFPWTNKKVQETLLSYLPQQGLFRLRLMVTAGEGGASYFRPQKVHPRFFFLWGPVRLEETVEQLDLNPRRNLPLEPPKTLSGLTRVLAAPDHGQEWVTVSPEGWLTECTTANIFWFFEGCLQTPRLNEFILDGLTRHRVIGLASELGLEIKEDDFLPDVLDRAEVIFLTSSVAGIRRVKKWRERAFEAHERCELLREKYSQLEDQELSKGQSA